MESAKGVLEISPHGGEAVVSGLGFRPKAVVAWWTQQERSEGVETGNAGGFGLWSASGCGAVAWASAHGTARATARTAATAGALLGVDAQSGDVVMAADGVRLDGGGFALEWGQPPSHPWVVHYLAIGGEELSARVGWSEPAAGAPALDLTPAANGTRALVLAACAPGPGEHENGLGVGIGVVAGRDQAAASYCVPNGAAPGTVVGAQSPSAGVVLCQETGTTASGTIDLDSGAGSVRRLETGGRPLQICHLALDGVRCTSGVALSPSSPGRRRTKVGFAPEALLLVSWGLAPWAHPKPIGRLCVGATASGSSGCGGWDDRNDEAEVTATHAHSSTRKVLHVVDTMTGGTHATATVGSLDANGFTLEWPESDGKEREFAYLALASATPSRRRLFRDGTASAGRRSFSPTGGGARRRRQGRIPAPGPPVPRPRSARCSPRRRSRCRSAPRPAPKERRRRARAGRDV